MIQTEPTPNPNALKFMPLRDVRGNKGPLHYKKDSDKNPKEESDIANSLFGIKGIKDVFFGSDFITIGKEDIVEWEEIKEPIIFLIEANSGLPFVKEKIVNNLKEVFDPEMSINVYDLGLIYEININEAHVDIVMTLTSAFCPAADEIIADVHNAVTKVEGVETCDVKVTFDPPFGPDKMSEDARLILGI